jgi:hypothetical protein
LVTDVLARVASGGEPEEQPFVITSSSGYDIVDESLVARPIRLPEEEDATGSELEFEYDLLAGRCSKTPSPKF